MIKLTESTNAFFCGPVRSGKTFLLRKLLAEHNRYVRFDYTGETMKEGDATVEHFYKPLPLLERLEKNPFYFRIAYHPGKNVMEHYKWCQRAIWQFDTPRLLAIDEVHRVFPQGPKLDEDAETAIRLARHNQLALIGASQRPQDVIKIYIDSCDLCVIYRSQEENFLNACAGHWGSEVADAVETMRPLIYRDVTKKVIQVPQCVVIVRDGNPARLYDFKTDEFLPLSASRTWNKNITREKIEDADESDSLRTDLDEEGGESNRLHDAEGNSSSE